MFFFFFCASASSHLVPGAVSFMPHLILRATPLLQPRTFVLNTVVIVIVNMVVVMIMVVIRPDVQTRHETLQICKETKS